MLKGYQKHHFWFGEEALKPEFLSAYIRSEKIAQAHHNAAWAEQTGKGVLFYAKREEDKDTPAGLIMLVSDIMLLCPIPTADSSPVRGHQDHQGG